MRWWDGITDAMDMNLGKLQEMVDESSERSVMSDSLRPHGLYSPWNIPGQNTGVGSCLLFQGIFLTQESSWDLLYCRLTLYPLSYQGSLRVNRISNLNYTLT